jgi:hypothetical protein
MQDNSDRIMAAVCWQLSVRIMAAVCWQLSDRIMAAVQFYPDP